MFSRYRARRLDTQATEAKDAGRIDEAIPLYRQAIAVDPSWARPLFNLGLVYKYLGHWEQSYDLNQKALALEPDDPPTLWNLGIAATALGDWSTARRAWTDYGIQLPEGEGPVDLPCGITPVRLHPNGEAEVVWCERIGPARAVITSIPFGASGHGWKDVVLNDGAPNGYRTHNGHDYPVLDELQLLETSPFGTFVARIELSDAAFDIEALYELGDSETSEVEDWTTNTRILCQSCSEGIPCADHDHSPDGPVRERSMAIAALSLAEAREIVDRWSAAVPGLRVLSLETELEPRHSLH